MLLSKVLRLLCLMKNISYSYVKLYEYFIRDSKNGKRRLKNGNKIAPSSIANYSATLKKLREFEASIKKDIQVRHLPSLSRREQLKETKNWAKFGREFSFFLQEQGLLNNYVGFHMKNLKAFHRYLYAYRLIDTGAFNEYFIVLKEESPIIVLSTERLQFLCFNPFFKASLPELLQLTLNIFIFGCTTSLRFSDIARLKRSNLQLNHGSTYLICVSKKTGTETRIKLPDYCLDIVKLNPGKNSNLFAFISLSYFNANLKKIFELAGWTELAPKVRLKGGVSKVIKTKNGKAYRFCDHASSHLMRKSAITNMLLLGMPEVLVRKVSGHAPNSKEFYRYVKYSQSFLDEHTDKVFERMATL